MTAKNLPKDIVFELSKNLILLKTNSKSIIIECEDFSEEIKLNVTYSIIKANRGCKIIGENFFIDSYHGNYSMDYESASFEVKYFYPEMDDRSRTKLNTEIGKNFAVDTGVLKKDLKDIKISHEENQNKMAILEEIVKKNHQITYSIVGTIFMFIILIGSLFCCIKKKCCCFKEPE